MEDDKGLFSLLERFQNHFWRISESHVEGIALYEIGLDTIFPENRDVEWMETRILFEGKWMSSSCYFFFAWDSLAFAINILTKNVDQERGRKVACKRQAQASKAFDCVVLFFRVLRRDFWRVFDMRYTTKHNQLSIRYYVLCNSGSVLLLLCEPDTDFITTPK